MTLKLYNAVLRAGAIAFCWAMASQAVGAAAIEVQGWPMPDLSTTSPDTAIGDDPVFGRLACPPITRLNLDRKRSEPLLIKRVVEEFNDPAKGSLWRIEMRNDVYWWNGDMLEAVHMTAFLKSQLASIAKERFGVLWPLPEFTVMTEARDSIAIRWKTPPAFGPYILNGVPLWRAAKQPASGAPRYECTGLYAATSAGEDIALKPSKGYGGSRPELVLKSESAKPPKGGSHLHFQSASFFGGSPWARLSDEAATCKQRVELPFVTMLNWNTQTGVTASKEFRRIMTGLTPRGELLRSGAANLGELISGPIPRKHPGYNSQVLVRPFSMEKGSTDLDKLGYRRKRADAPRERAGGTELRLRIGTSATSSGLVEKVLADAFIAVGIAAEFVPKAQAKVPLDGALTGVWLEWPRSDLLRNFHSRLTGDEGQSYPFWPLADKDLDRELEAYTLSLTTAAPDFSLLARIHSRLFDLEPATLLMQHEACIEASADHAAKLKGISVTDPDWFRRLIL